MALKSVAHYAPLVRVGRYRVERFHLGYAAEILRAHAQRKRVLRELEAQVIHGTSREDNTGMPRGSGVSDPTPLGVVRLDDPQEPSFRARAHLRGLIQTVERYLQALSTDHRAIVVGVYIDQTKTVVGVAQDLHVSQARAYRLRNEALLALAVDIIGSQILLPKAAT